MGTFDLDMKASTSRRKPKRRSFDRAARQSLGREDWLGAARAEITAAGVNAVKIGRLAKRLGVTRASFYWHFTSRHDLLRALLKSWEHMNTVLFERVLSNGSAGDGPREMLTIFNLWLDESDFSPAYDAAIRDWMRTSREVASVVRRVDEGRIAVLHRVFKNLGFADPEALVRARLMYCQQVGYYVIDFREDRSRRRALAPIGLHVLSGLPLELISASLSLEQTAAKEANAAASRAVD